MTPCKTLCSIAALAIVPLLSLPLPAQAEAADDARHLLDGALAEIQAGGLDRAVRHINAGGGKSGAQQLVALQLDGTVLAHSANGKLPGKCMLQARDASGKTFVKDAIDAARSSGAGQVDVRWGNPVTRQIADGTMYVRRVPGQDVVIAALVFK